MCRVRAVFLCSLIFFAILPANWAVQGQLSEDNLTNISLEDSDSKKSIYYNISFNLSGTISNNNATYDTISSQVKKAIQVGMENPDILVKTRRILSDSRSGYSGGKLDIKSVCVIYDYLQKGDGNKSKWQYFPDPIVAELVQNASFSFKSGEPNNVGSGDCDDYAVAISTLVENVGGATMILIAKTKGNGLHMYSMVFLGYEEDVNDVKKIKNWLNGKYNTTNTEVITIKNKNKNKNKSEYWLSLDWSEDFPFPGGSKPLSKPEIIREINGPKKSMNLANMKPDPVIDYDKSLLVADEPIWFDSSKSNDEDGGIRNCEWDFGDNTTNESMRNVTHIYGNPGKYNVILNLTDNIGDFNYTKVSLSVSEPRPLDIAFKPGLPRVREDITFIAAGIKGRKHYNWSFGDESYQQGANLTTCRHSYENAGRYFLNLTTVDDKNKTRSNVSWIVVNDPPHAKLGWDPHLPNVKEKISFSGKGSTDDLPLKDYIWSFGDGANATGRDVYHVYEKGGTYLASLRVIDEYNGTDDAQETIEVNSPPSAHFSYYPSSPTTEDDVSFDASLSSDPDPKSSIKAYEWDFGDRKKGSGLYPEHRYEKEGNFTVKLTVIDDNDLRDTTHPREIWVQNKNVLHPPTAHINFVPGKGITTEDEVIFDASWSSDVDGGGLKYEWDIDDGTRSNKSSFSHRFSKEGEHTVNLTVKDEDNLNSSVSRRLSVEKPKDPVSFFTCKPDAFEAGKEITFNASLSQGDNLSWRWDFGDKSPIKDGAVVNYTYPPKGFEAATYNVTLTVKDKRDKENSSSKQLRIEPAKAEPLVPLFIFEPKSPVAGQEVSFNATSSKGSIKSFEWNYGDGSSIGTKAIGNHTFPANESVEITYQVILTLTDINGDKGRKSMNISVSPPPPPPLHPLFSITPQDPIVGQQVIFNATSSRGAIANYLWDFGDGSAQRDDAIVPHAFTASLKSARTYDVTLTVADKKGRMFNSTRKVTVLPPQFPTINPLGIETSSGMSMYYHCEIYDQVKMVANSYSGSATFTEQYPNGDEKFRDYQFMYGRNEITFAADRLGEHIMGYMINGLYSNIVIIYVVEKGTLGDYISPSNSLQPVYQSSIQMNPINVGMSYDRSQSIPSLQSLSSFPTHHPGQSSLMEKTHYPGQTSQLAEDWLS